MRSPTVGRDRRHVFTSVGTPREFDLKRSTLLWLARANQRGAEKPEEEGRTYGRVSASFQIHNGFFVLTGFVQHCAEYPKSQHVIRLQLDAVPRSRHCLVKLKGCPIRVRRNRMHKRRQRIEIDRALKACLNFLVDISAVGGTACGG